MKLLIGGVRGTNPVSQPDFMAFGGETTSFLFEGEGGDCVLVDAGTGIRILGQYLEKSHPAANVLLLLTHYHLDHIIGLPSLSLLYKEQWTIELAAPVRDEFRVEDVMQRLFDKPLWPLQVEDLASHLRFKTLRGGSSSAPLRYGGLEVRWCPARHPGGCTAYRIDEPATGASCVVATDIEWRESSEAQQAALIELCCEPQPAHVLIMDGQYTPEEYKRYRGWGHSTWKDCAEAAARADIARLLVTHHAPTNDDARLAAIEQDLARTLPAARLARERMEITLNG